MNITAINLKHVLLVIGFSLFALMACEKEDPNDPGNGGGGGGDPDPPVEGTINFDCSEELDSLVLSINPKAEDGIDYLISCELVIHKYVSVEPGVVVAFENDASLIVSDTASISALGESDNWITFRGKDSATTGWSGIHVFSKEQSNRFKYVSINGGGASDYNGNGFAANVVIYKDGRLKFEKSEIVNSFSNGIYVAGGGIMSYFSENKISGSKGYPLVSSTNQVTNLKEDNDLSGNDINAILINSVSTLSGTHKYIDLGLDYIMDVDLLLGTDSKSGVLTLDPGVQMIMTKNNGIYVNSISSFTINGGANNMVNIEGEENTAGYWKGILINSLNSSNDFKNVRIADAGGLDFPQDSDFFDIFANVILSRDGKLTLSNVSIENSFACGIYSDPLADLQLNNIEYKNNQKDFCEE